MPCPRLSKGKCGFRDPTSHHSRWRALQRTRTTSRRSFPRWEASALTAHRFPAKNSTAPSKRRSRRKGNSSMRSPGRTGKSIDWLAEDAQRHAIVVAGRPYHTDPRLMRGIDTMLTKLGFAILCPTSSDTWATRSTARPESPAMETGQAPCTPRSLRCRESAGRSCVPAIIRLRLRRAEPRRRARHPRSGRQTLHRAENRRPLRQGAPQYPTSYTGRGNRVDEPPRRKRAKICSLRARKSANAQLAAQPPAPWPQHRMSGRSVPQSKASQATQRPPKFRAASSSAFRTS